MPTKLRARPTNSAREGDPSAAAREWAHPSGQFCTAPIPHLAYLEINEPAHLSLRQIDCSAGPVSLCRGMEQGFQMLFDSRPFTSRKSGATDLEYRRTLAQAIVDTVREPLLVLDQDLRVVAASRSFCLTFRVNRQDTQGRLLYALGGGQWDIPALRALLEKIIPEHGELEAYQVEHEFPEIGRRVMLLNAREVVYQGSNHRTLLLAIEDITQRRATERRLQQLLGHKELLVQEMQHRIGNSLQIVASILRLKADTAPSEETRVHLYDAHARVMAAAAAQQHLHATGGDEPVAAAPYLSKLCATLGGSMISDDRAVSIEVLSDAASLSSTEAVSIGLIVTESVLNALKHAFTPDMKNGRIVVTYKADARTWKLSIADNGTGKRKRPPDDHAGLGTNIVNALAEQLNARVDIVSSPRGTTVSVVRAAGTRLLHAA